MNYGEDITRPSSTPHHALSIFRPTIELPLDELLDSCSEEMPSASSELDTNTMAHAVGDSDVVMQDLAGPSPPIPKTGATPTPSTTATSPLT